LDAASLRLRPASQVPAHQMESVHTLFHDFGAQNAPLRVFLDFWLEKIHMRLDGPYDDRVGPGLLAIGLLAGFAVSLSMHIAEGGSADVLKVKHG
jgi:hypothetical protein